MPDPSYWPEVTALAQHWGDSPLVMRHKDYVTSVATSDATHMWTDGLSQLKTMFPEELRQPFKLAQWLPALIGATNAKLPISFAEDSLKMYAASAGTVAWLRGQLPGYPLIKAPQLARGSHLTTNEFAWEIPWRHEDYGRQLQSTPFDNALPIGVGVGDPAAFSAAVVALLTRLTLRAEWREFGDARSSLNNDDKSQLTQVRSRISQRLSPAEMDGCEFEGAIASLAHRANVVSEEIAGLGGQARAFADAFDRVNNLLDLVCVNVVSHLVFFGQPRLVKLGGGLEFSGGPPADTLSFLADDVFRPGEFIAIDDTLFSGFSQVTATQFTQTEEMGTRITVTARLLD